MNISLKVIGSLLGGMLVAQIWNASTPSSSNRLCLTAENEIEINYRDTSSDFDLTLFISELRKLGVFSMKRFVTQHPPGWGFHHAGCLPMRSSPSEFETHVDGRLWNSRRVRVIDGSVLPSLPAKNHSLTVMANASRIADEVIKCGF
jgi:choline dehydrogenase-like flavoprotein